MKQIRNYLFKDTELTDFPLINAVLLNVQEGKVFTDDEEYVSFVFHKSAFSYLSMHGNSGYVEMLDYFVESSQFPVYFHIYNAPSAFIKACETNDSINSKVRTRTQLKFTGRYPALVKTNLPPFYTIEKINETNFHLLVKFNLMLDSKFWNSEKDFLQNGFGFIINNESGNPVSICYAACVAKRTVEIDVATLPGYEKKGLARIVVNRFVEYCIDNDLIANWDCFTDNIASLKTALALGFSQTMEYPFLSVFNKKRTNETI